MRITPRLAATAAAVLIGTATIGTAALATPAGPPGNAPAPGVITSGTLDGPARAENKRVSLIIKGDTTVRSFDLTYKPRSYSGWHAHPGIVVAVVKSGTVKRWVGDKIATFTVGDAFTEVEPHCVFNDGTTDAVLAITQLYAVGVPANRIEIDRAGCDNSLFPQS